MANRTWERWKEFFTGLALSALGGWGILSGVFFDDARMPGWLGVLAFISWLFLFPMACAWTLLQGAGLLFDWTAEEERAKEDTLEQWFLGCVGVVVAIVLALLLLVGVIWLVKTIWYAV